MESPKEKLEKSSFAVWMDNIKDFKDGVLDDVVFPDLERNEHTCANYWILKSNLMDNSYLNKDSKDGILSNFYNQLPKKEKDKVDIGEGWLQKKVKEAEAKSFAQSSEKSKPYQNDEFELN